MIDFTAADALLSQGNLPAARAAYLELAAQAAAENDAYAQVRSLALVAEIDIRSEALDTAEESLLQAEAVGNTIGNPGVTAGLLQVRGLLAVRREQWDEALKAYTKLEAAAEEIGNTQLAFEAMSRQGGALLMANRLDDALEEYESAVIYATQHNQTWLIPALSNVGVSLRLLQRHGEALEAFRRMLGVAAAHGMANHLRIAKLEVATSLADVGEVDLARQGLTEVLREFKEAGEPQMAEYAQARLDNLPTVV